MTKKTKSIYRDRKWGGYFEFFYKESEDSKPIKFLARDDKDAELYVDKVEAYSWGFKEEPPRFAEV